MQLIHSWILHTVRQFCDAALSETNLGELHARMKDLLEEAFTVSMCIKSITMNVTNNESYSTWMVTWIAHYLIQQRAYLMMKPTKCVKGI